MTKAEMTKKIAEYVIDTYFQQIKKGADGVSFLMIFSDGHGGKDFETVRKNGYNPDFGYACNFGLDEFKKFCITTNAVKIKADSKNPEKSTAGKAKAEIRISNTAYFKAIAGKKLLAVNLQDLKNSTMQDNNGNAFECALQVNAGMIENATEYKKDNTRFDKTGDIITKNGIRIQAKTNRCSLTYLSTLDKLQPMPEEIKLYCEACGFIL